MHVDGTVAHDDILPPNRKVDLFAGEDLSGLGNQQAKEFKFLPGKNHLLVADFHQISLLIDQQVAESQGIVGLGDFGFGGGRGQSFQQGFDPADEHLGPDGLGDVVVGTGFKTGNLGIVFPAGGQKGDQGLLQGRNLPDLLAGGDPVHFRHHQVKKDQVRLVPLGQLQPLPAIVGRKYRKAFLLQVVTDELQNVHFIIDQKNLQFLFTHRDRFFIVSQI